MNEILNSFSSFFYEWLLDTTDDSFGVVWNNDGPGGMKWAFILLFCISLLTVLVYYFVIAKSNASNDTPKNYLITVFFGYVVLVASTIAFLPLIINNNSDNAITYSHLWTLDTLYVCLWNIALYILFVAIFSWFIKSSVHSNVSMGSIIASLFK